MKTRTLIAGYALALALFLFAQHRPGSSSPNGFRGVVDLTHSLEKPSYEIKTVARVEKEYLGRNNASPEWFGTRMEAPAEFAHGLWTVGQIPAERLIAPLVVLDVSQNIADHPDYQISVEDIAKWEQVHDQIPLASVVIARTGWGSRWNSVRDYRNADAKGVLHFPGYSPDAAKFLVQGRNVLGLGIDTLSIDHGSTRGFPVRQYTLAHSVYQLENVANLDRAPAAGGMVVVAPAKLENGSSSPVRILALVR
jgi:kynurenine formamidase